MSWASTSAMVVGIVSRLKPMLTISSTPASFARAITASRSSSNLCESRWAWESTSMRNPLLLSFVKRPSNRLFRHFFRIVQVVRALLLRTGADGTDHQAFFGNFHHVPVLRQEQNRRLRARMARLVHVVERVRRIVNLRVIVRVEAMPREALPHPLHR